jgi:hypothetical protein
MIDPHALGSTWPRWYLIRKIEEAEMTLNWFDPVQDNESYQAHLSHLQTLETYL